METMIQPKVTGYRQLSPEEAALMNEIKALGPQIEALREKAAVHIQRQRTAAEGDEVEQARLDRARPEHWLGWGADSMQSAMMFMTRAIAQPTAF